MKNSIKPKKKITENYYNCLKSIMNWPQWKRDYMGVNTQEILNKIKKYEENHPEKNEKTRWNSLELY